MSRTKRAAEIIRARKLQRHLRGLIPEDKSWQLELFCDTCGRKVCVNNNPHHVIAVESYKGQPVCPWCGPRKHRQFDERDNDEIRARTVKSLILAQELAAIARDPVLPMDEIERLCRKALKLWEEPIPGTTKKALPHNGKRWKGRNGQKAQG